MAHPPYSIADRLLEFGWLGLFGGVVIAAWSSRARHRTLISAIILTLVYSRLRLQSVQGFLPLFEVPLLVLAVVLAVLGLRGPFVDVSNDGSRR